jgi:hypothetical protein
MVIGQIPDTMQITLHSRTHNDKKHEYSPWNSGALHQHSSTQRIYLQMPTNIYEIADKTPQNTLKVTWQWVQPYPYESCGELLTKCQTINFTMNRSHKLPWLPTVWCPQSCIQMSGNKLRLCSWLLQGPWNKKKEKREKPEKETNQHKQKNCSLHTTLYTLQDNFRMTLQGAKVSLRWTHKRTLKVNNKCLEWKDWFLADTKETDGEIE